MQYPQYRSLDQIVSAVPVTDLCENDYEVSLLDKTLLIPSILRQTLTWLVAKSVIANQNLIAVKTLSTLNFNSR